MPPACNSRTQNNPLAQFAASPDLHNEFLSAQIRDNPDLPQKLLDELVPIIYKGLKVIYKGLKARV